MYFSEIAELVRKFTADEADAYNISDRDLLVDDVTIGQYMTVAEQQFCRDTGYIRDRTGAPTQIVLAQGDQVITLDPSIIFVYAARLNGAVLPNNKRLMDVLDESAPEQQPSEYALDLASHTLYLNTPADQAYTIKLTVWRLPTNAITGTRAKQVPEIPAQYHLALAHYAAFMVFSNSDEELLDNRAAVRQRSLYQTFAIEGKRQAFLIQDFGGEPEVDIGALGWSW